MYSLCPTDRANKIHYDVSIALGILEMIMLHLSTQGEDIIEHNNGKCRVFLYFSMQEEDIYDYTNVKCHLCTL